MPAQPSSVKSRVAVFDAIHELDFNEDGTVTDEQRAVALEALLAVRPKGRLDPEDYPMVTKWLDNMALYTPFIDEIAVERAVALESEELILALSIDERAELHRRLAVHPEPYGPVAVAGNQHVTQVEGHLAPRRARWFALSADLRRSISRGTQAARGRNLRTAA